MEARGSNSGGRGGSAAAQGSGCSRSPSIGPTNRKRLSKLSPAGWNSRGKNTRFSASVTSMVAAKSSSTPYFAEKPAMSSASAIISG